jgi:hypothetical protein
MDRFIECLCFDNYESLIISGTAPKEVLLSSWLTILTEYHELKGNDLQDNEVWILQREIIRTNHHLGLLQQCIDVLWFEYRESIANSVRDLGYSFYPTSHMPNLYRQDLVIVANEAKTKYIELEQYSERLKKLLPPTDEKLQPEVFEDMLTAFESVQKVSYSLTTITVTKFVMLERKYKALVDAMDAKKLKNGY